jgi:Tol biopolymer transport system component
VDGAPVVVLEHPDGGMDAVALARNGTLLYTRRSDANVPVLVNAAGTARPMFDGMSGWFMNPRYSPDGRRLVIQGTSPQGTDVWVYDVASHTRAQLTTLGSALGPTWAPDGQRIVFLSTEGGRTALWVQPADGSAPATRVAEGDGMFAADVAPDGRVVLFQRMGGSAWGIWSAPTSGDGQLRPVVVERFDAFMPALSPDGRWLAYAANASGRYEIYARPFPGPGAAVQVSEGGGTEPAWSRDGRRLYFRGDRRMRSATIVTRPALAVTERATLFTEAFDGDMPMPHRNYDVAPNGQGFVMIAAAADVAPETIVVLGWLGELRARLAAVR